MLTHQEMKKILHGKEFRFLGNLTNFAISAIKLLVIWPILEVLVLMRGCQSLCWSQSSIPSSLDILWSVLKLASHHTILRWLDSSLHCWNLLTGSPPTQPISGTRPGAGPDGWLYGGGDLRIDNNTSTRGRYQNSNMYCVWRTYTVRRQTFIF